MSDDNRIIDQDGRVEVVKKREIIEGTPPPVPTPIPTYRFAMISRILRRREEEEERFVQAAKANVEAKMDYLRVRDKALDLERIIQGDRDQRTGDLAAQRLYRESQERLLVNAKKLDEIAHKKLVLQEENEIARLEKEAANRELSLDDRLKKEMKEKLERSRTEKLLKMEELKMRREMISLLEEQKQEQIDQHVQGVKRHEERDIDPSDRSTWSERDEQYFTDLDNDFTELAQDM